MLRSPCVNAPCVDRAPHRFPAMPRRPVEMSYRLPCIDIACMTCLVWPASMHQLPSKNINIV